jgi:hypothetical protein
MVRDFRCCQRVRFEGISTGQCVGTSQRTIIEKSNNKNFDFQITEYKQ